MYDFIVNCDFAILDFISSFRSEFFDGIMLAVTALGDKGVLWILLTLAMLCIPQTRKLGVCMALSLLINFILVNLTVKPLVGRIRPFDLKSDIELLLEAPADYSFPSGHTSASFAVAVAVLFFNKKWGMSLIVLSSVIAFSRLYLYVHFPTDIIGGIIFGVVSAFCSHFICRKIFKRYKITL